MKLNNDWQLSDLDFDKLKAALSSWPAWAETVPNFLHPLSKGLTNSSYLIEVGGAYLVLRINSSQSDMIGLDRAAEVKLLNAASNSDFVPKLVYADPDLSFLLTEFIKGDQWALEQSNSNDGLVQLSNLLKRIHRLKPMGDILSIEDKVKRYWHYSKLPEDLTAKLQKLQPEIDFHLAEVNDNFLEPCLCHNDLVPENIIYNNKMMYVLDWEYASMGDPFFDLAIVVEEHKLDQQSIVQLMTGYLGEAVSSRQLKHLYHCRVLYCYLTILWYGVKYSESTLNEIKLSIDRQLNHLNKLLVAR